MIMTTSQRMELTSSNSNSQTVATLTKTDSQVTPPYTLSTTANEEIVVTSPHHNLVSET